MKYIPIVVLAFIIILASSCANVKNLQYLQGRLDTTRLKSISIPEPTIQKGDLLGITVYSDDPLATMAVTNPVTNTNPYTSLAASATGGATPAATSAVSGFLVSQQGDVQIYKLGTIHAEGKTKKQLADTMALLYAQQGLLKNPFVEVRFMNFKVSVIGEVNHPGPISVPSDKVNAFEAIGLAGDITVYGRRDNLLVIREANGVREFGRLDLTKPDVFLSPYYYLRQNDMVIVDVNKNKASVNNQNTFQMISLGMSALSLAIVIYSVFRK